MAQIPQMDKTRSNNTWPRENTGFIRGGGGAVFSLALRYERVDFIVFS